MYYENLHEKILRFEHNVIFWGEFFWSVHICPTLALKTSRKQRSCDEVWSPRNVSSNSQTEIAVKRKTSQLDASQ